MRVLPYLTVTALTALLTVGQFAPHRVEVAAPAPDAGPNPDLVLDFEAFAAKHFPREHGSYLGWLERSSRSDRELADAVAAAGRDKIGLAALTHRAYGERCAAEGALLQLKFLVEERRKKLGEGAPARAVAPAPAA